MTWAPGVVVRHLFLAAGLSSLVLLAVVAALLSVEDRTRRVTPRTASTLAIAVGVGAVLLGGAAVARGVGGLGAGLGWLTVPPVTGGWRATAVAGATLLAVALPVRLAPGRIRLGHLLGAAAVAAVVAGGLAGIRIDAFGSRRALGVPIQSVAVAAGVAAFLPMGHAARRGTQWRWPLAAAAVGAPFGAVAPAVPVGGLGPFLVGLFMTLWTPALGALGCVLFALGWATADGDPRRSARSLATGVAAVGGVGTVLSLGALPQAGLLVVPLVPILVAYLVFGLWTRYRPAVTAEESFLRGPVAALAGVGALLVHGTARFGPEYVGHVARPPSLLLSSLALAVTPFALFALGRTTRRNAHLRWVPALATVGLPAAVVGAATLRPYDLGGIWLAAVLAVVAYLLGIPAWYLGRAVAAESDTRGSY